MVRSIAGALNGDFDVVLTRKLHAPGQPASAIGAVDETGWRHVADYAPMAGATQEYIDDQVAAELATMQRRRAQ